MILSIPSQSRLPVAAVLLGMTILLGAPHGATAQTLSCLPTCSTVDGRFLAITGSNLGNLSMSGLNLSVAAPVGTATFTLGFFDGDANGLDGTGVSHWDTSNAAVYEYTLYADPLGDGSGSIPVEISPGLTTLLSTSMPDNAWIDYTINNIPAAETPSAAFFYRLEVRLTTPQSITTNAFKIRTSGIVSGFPLDPAFQPISLIANLRGLADLQIVYPAYPSTTPTNYDGLFQLYFDLPTSQSELAVWDGDFDRGKFDGTDLDTDDPDTPLLLPPWATPAAVAEGIASGASGTTGNPPDDRSTAGAGTYNSKSPSVSYELVFPDSQTFLNSNPSGNLEWEQFKISTDPFNGTEMDYSTTSIPAGTYELRATGVDMQNLDSFLLPGRLLCVDENGVPCALLHPFLVSATVFRDSNGNGLQDGEPGLAGVTLELVDELGEVISTAVTGADGRYSFPVEAETWTVYVADSNFTPGGPLAGWISTTGGSRTETVIDANVLTGDFGYRGTLSIGDRVWNDRDGDRVQDSGEHGISGATVQLYDAAGNLVATATTNSGGNYSFSSLPPGNYTLRLVPSTLPPGLSPTYDLDGLATPHAATLTLGTSRADADFGYRRRA